VDTRKDKALTFLGGELTRAKEEPLSDLTPTERSFWRGRIIDLEKAISRIKDEDVSPEELHRAFRRDEVEMRAKNVDPAMREQIETFQNTQSAAAALAEEDAENQGAGDWSSEEYDPSEESFEGDIDSNTGDEVL
jgi:hypothetical protein